MKIAHFFFGLFILALFTQCDIIDGNPYTNINSGGGSGEDVKKSVLLLEFTGHRCPNCPHAHEEVKKLSEAFGDILIPIAIHAGTLALPIPNYLPADFRTDFGTSLYETLGQPSLPAGIIGKIDANEVTQLAAWATQVEEQRNIPTTIKIDFENSIDNNTINTQVNVTNTDATATLNSPRLYVVLLEDGIVSPQLFGSNTIDDYVHNHVLRHAFSNNLGDGFEFNEQNNHTASYSIAVNADWDSAQLSIVAFIVDSENNIIQAAYKHLE